MGYGVIGSPADSGSASLGSSPGTPAPPCRALGSDTPRAPSSSGLGRRPLKAVARVRIPSGLQTVGNLSGRSPPRRCRHGGYFRFLRLRLVRLGSGASPESVAAAAHRRLGGVDPARTPRRRTHLATLVGRVGLRRCRRGPHLRHRGRRRGGRRRSRCRGPALSRRSPRRAAPVVGGRRGPAVRADALAFDPAPGEEWTAWVRAASSGGA